MVHPTQIFLHSPQALRVEYRLDDGRLMLWWSPLAGKSYAARDRNFSNRDDHLDVFDRIELPGCDLADFEGCDYNPFYTVLRFRRRVLHFAVRIDAPILLLWSDRELVVDLKTGRYDEVIRASEREFVVRHEEVAHRFEFAAAIGKGVIRHSPVHAEWNSHYAQARVDAGGVLAIGVGLDVDGIAEDCARCAIRRPEAHLDEIDGKLANDEMAGTIAAPGHPEMESLRRSVVRGLVSMIDESGGFRASLKAIYYLIWVRDAAFALCCMEAAGWPHKLSELCRLFLANATVVRGDDVPSGRMFGQLIHPEYGKYEDDGAFYVVWTVFTHWTQTGSGEFIGGAHRELIDEAVNWVERRCFHPESGMFEGYFADETPALGSRDFGWDYAIGKPSGDEHIRIRGHRIVRSRDLYLNALMFSTYRMLAAISEPEAAKAWELKARALWNRIEDWFCDLDEAGLPPYGDLLDDDGTWHRVRRWGPVSSVYVWALAVPHFLPIQNRDAVQGALLRELAEQPAMHWINGICAAIAAADPWVHGEERPLALLLRVKDESLRAGEFLPMGGAMPEKFDAPQGSFYHDIRPQGFAMGAWLAAWASLGVRRLPFGLAVRPVQAFQSLENFKWRGKSLHFYFGPQGRALVLEINDVEVLGTLQIPERLLEEGENRIRLVESSFDGPLLIRSTLQLDAVHQMQDRIEWKITGFGAAECVFVRLPDRIVVWDAGGVELPVESRNEGDLTVIRFELRGAGQVVCC